MAYLFVHFREKSTPDGEQVHFGLSKDGFHWEMVNNGEPITWAYHGDKGVRDFTITRCKDGRFIILATDLSLSYGMRNHYHNSWDEINVNGSKHLAIWESANLVDWSEQRLIHMGDDDFGCVWAPDIIYDEKNQDYLIHWSSSHKSNGYKGKRIYYCRTKDFDSFSKPELLFEVKDGNVIDSAIYEEDGLYYLFVKSEANPARIWLYSSDKPQGPYASRIERFDEHMEPLERGKYEAPTAVRLEDGRWCLFLDHYGVAGTKQGYVPFVAPSLASGDFVRSDEEFEFPYGFKHGTILRISDEEYDRIKDHDFTDKGWS